MKNYTWIGCVLIGLAIAAFFYQGNTYTTREKAFELGSLQVTTEKTHRIPVEPIVGTVLLIGGVLFLIATKKQFARS
jgi:hypothetical protein